MLMRRLGRTGLKVAALCLGGNTFGWTTDQKASEAVLDAYLEAGGNFIDTADVYSRWAPGNKGGESETALGTWMAARKNRAARRHRDEGDGPDGAGPERHGPLARAHRAGRRGLAAPPADRLHRPLPGALGRSRHAARRDAARLRRPRAPGQGALHRRLELRRRGGSPGRCGRATSAATCATSRSSRSTTSCSATSTSASSSRSASSRASGVIPYSSLGERLPLRQVPPRARICRRRRAPAGVQKTYMNDRGFAVLAAVEKVAAGAGATPARSRSRGWPTGRGSRRPSPARPRWLSSRRCWAASSCGWTRRRPRRSTARAPGARPKPYSRRGAELQQLADGRRGLEARAGEHEHGALVRPDRAARERAGSARPRPPPTWARRRARGARAPRSASHDLRLAHRDDRAAASRARRAAPRARAWAWTTRCPRRRSALIVGRHEVLDAGRGTPRGRARSSPPARRRAAGTRADLAAAQRARRSRARSPARCCRSRAARRRCRARGSRAAPTARRRASWCPRRRTAASCGSRRRSRRSGAAPPRPRPGASP